MKLGRPTAPFTVAALCAAICIISTASLRAENTSAPDSDGVNTSAAPAEAPASAPQAPVTCRSGQPVPTINGELDFVMCGNGHLLRVYNQNIDGEMFRAQENEAVIPVQGFRGKVTRNKWVAGVNLHFMLIQF